jgi:hypothetical protein
MLAVQRRAVRLMRKAAATRNPPLSVFFFSFGRGSGSSPDNAFHAARNCRRIELAALVRFLLRSAVSPTAKLGSVSLALAPVLAALIGVEGVEAPFERVRPPFLAPPRVVLLHDRLLHGFAEPPLGGAGAGLRLFLRRLERSFLLKLARSRR